MKFLFSDETCVSALYIENFWTEFSVLGDEKNPLDHRVVHVLSLFLSLVLFLSQQVYVLLFLAHGLFPGPALCNAHRNTCNQF